MARRKPGWHGLGKVFTEGELTTLEGLEQIPGGDVDVITVPATILLPTGEPMVTGQQAIIRLATVDDPQRRFFGFAGPDYEPLTNRLICETLDPISKKWPLETIGILEDGRRLFLTLRVGHGQVAGEDVDEYFLITEGKDGESAVKMAYTPVRVVCKNTLVLGLSQASFNLNIRHTKGAQDELEFATRIMELAKVARERSLEALNQMALAKVVEEQVTEILEAAYPVPPVPKKVSLLRDLEQVHGLDTAEASFQKLQAIDRKYSQLCDQVAGYRSGARELVNKLNDEYPNIANTAWAVYNAVVECEDYRNAPTNTDGQEKIDASTIWGTRAQTKVRAFNAAYAVSVN